MQIPRKALHFMLWSAMAALLATSVRLLAQQTGDHPVVNKAATAKLAPVPNVPDCATAAVESGDPSKGPSILLIKLSAGCAVPWHWHTPNEHVMAVSGTGKIQMKGEKPVLLRSGDFAFAPSHHVHRFSCAGPCMIFLSSDGAFDIHYVDEAGKEMALDDALKAASTSTGNAKKQ